MWSESLNKLIDVNMGPDPQAKAYDPDEEIKYYIHKKNEKEPTHIDLRTIGSDNNDIDANGMWFFGVHGYQENVFYSPLKLLVQGKPIIIHGNRSANVIHVDWVDGASSNWYPTAANNVKPVAIAVAKVIRRLVETGLAKKELTHLIGFSLGAHVVGIIGQSLFETAGWKPWRISGLDPARPFFEGYPPEETIDPQDGEYVEIFHTTGGQLGVWRPHGQVDVYVNTGFAPQPGCGTDMFYVCSHSFIKRVFANYTNLEMQSYRCTGFEDFAQGKCNHDFNTACTVGFSAQNCKEGVYHLDTTKYFE
ncbi:unnamed protein product [Allacma fusca]|uniref:Lipase domain-containing protein n=1 Tax=Allacma fusca TaxID=39272 RepID=A0A8J2P6I2_9HEXA|nr:unnamed protein product [Allacma fusca]